MKMFRIIGWIVTIALWLVAVPLDILWVYFAAIVCLMVMGVVNFLTIYDETDKEIIDTLNGKKWES